MSLLCAVLVVVAVLLAVRAPVRPLPDTEVGSAAGPDEPRPAPRAAATGLRRALVGGLLVVAVLVTAHRLAGAPGVVVAVAAVIVLATAARLARAQRAGRSAARARAEVAHACSAVASQIRVGRVAAEALRSTAEDCPVLAVVSRAQALGGDVPQVLLEQARRPGHDGLADLARAWQVSATTGSPLAPSLERVAEALTADVALRNVVDGELSAPRATGKIMAALPFCGLGMGYLLGGDPVAFLLADPYGWACLVLGVALAAAGVLWIDRLAQQSVERG